MARCKAQALCASRLLKKTHPRERWGRKGHARDPGIVRGVPIALQEVLGHDASLHPRHRCQGEASIGHRIPRRVHSWIGHTLQVLVDRDALLMVNYLSTFWPIISSDFCGKWEHLTLLGSKLSMVCFERSIALHRHHSQDD